MSKKVSPDDPRARKKQVRLERVYAASIEDVWEAWTTKEGIESWWGPEGFAVTVEKLELRAGGELRYAMTAVGAPQIEFMKKANMPLTTHSRITFTEVTPQRRLAYDHLTDFIPGVAPYDVAHVIELEPTASGVRLTLTIDAMHDEVWTQRAVMGWESELDKLRAAVGSPAPNSPGGSQR
jgi:uncharacterized protein YndB with AHSA1/START domain